MASPWVGGFGNAAATCWKILKFQIPNPKQLSRFQIPIFKS
jgi:hypothetical protein